MLERAKLAQPHGRSHRSEKPKGTEIVSLGRALSDAYRH